jgi:hypothetical protein
VRGILKADLHGVLQIFPTRCGPCLAVAPLSEEIFEEIPEPTSTLAEPEITHVEIGEIRTFESTTGTSSRFKGPMPQLIVFLPEFGVAENMIGLRDLLETPLSFLVPRIQIGMMFTRQSTISLLNLLVGG